MLFYYFFWNNYNREGFNQIGGCMDGEMLYFIISIPEKFKDKFVNFLHNLNSANHDMQDPLKIVAVYTNNKEEGDNG